MGFLFGDKEEDHVVEATTLSFEKEVIRRSAATPVLVEIHSPRAKAASFSEALANVARRSCGAFRLVRVDVDENPDVATILGVRRVPTCVLFLGGRPVDAFVGALSEEGLRRFLERHIDLEGTLAREEEDAADTPEALLGEGRAKEALGRIRTGDDPLLELRAALLAGDRLRAERAMKNLPEEKAEDVVAQAAARVLKRLDGEELEPLKRGGVAEVLEALLVRGGGDRRLLLDLLLLLGRGPLPDGVRSRLSREVFK